MSFQKLTEATVASDQQGGNSMNWLFIGLIIGTVLGFFLAAMFDANGDDDE